MTRNDWMGAVGLVLLVLSAWIFAVAFTPLGR
jgi:hypothetical protein